MLKGLVTMSATEIDRLTVVEKIHDGRLMQSEAAKLLGLSSRQVRRLEAAYLRDGAAGLVSKKRGRRSNNTIKTAVQAEVMALVADRYGDFGPTLAAEKLVELHGLAVSRETLRKWMAAAGLWSCRHERVGKLHQPRKRRDCLGELIQVDGCEHAWFEDRGPPCTLLVFVDDATTQLMELHFAVSESTFDYFEATKCYLQRHGRPVALYSDKHSIFRVAREGTTGRNGGLTQYGRALGTLGREILCANSPQAKGRVERVHQTLQDRLVKELRLRGISNITDGNAFLPEFREDFNRRFAKPARSNHDAHRPLRESDNLEQIFTWQETRIMSRDLVVHYKRVTYLVQPNDETRRLAGNKRQVDVLERIDGTVEIRHQGRSLPYLIHEQQPQVSQGEVVENKRLGAVLAAIQAPMRYEMHNPWPRRSGRSVRKHVYARLGFRLGCRKCPHRAVSTMPMPTTSPSSWPSSGASRSVRLTELENADSNAKSRMRSHARLLAPNQYRHGSMSARQRSLSRSARTRQGCPRSARRLRRP
jgi:hypothetical protein